MKITIKAHVANVTNDEGEDYLKHEKLDGISDSADFVEYMHSDLEDIKNSLESGYMRFEFKDGFLWTVVEYSSTRTLTDDELVKLKDYTVGQLSDGIGEGFECNSCYNDNGVEIFISPWFSGMEVFITQE